MREREMSDEMRFHVEMEAAELVRMGVAPDEARRRALASFGGLRRYVEEGVEARGGNRLESLIRDVRYAVRSLRRTPGYAVVVMLTLAVGIAANTSIFSIANSILFRELPYRDPSRLLVIWDGLDWIGVPEAWVTGPEVWTLRRGTTKFDGFAATQVGGAALSGDENAEPQQLPRLSATANFFDVIGVAPAIGRGFAKGDDAPGAPRVAVISNRLFQQRYAGDRSIVGKSVTIDGNPTTIVGVMPPGFVFSQPGSLASASANVGVFLPLVDTLDRFPRGPHSFGVFARVRSDASVSAARAELAALSQQRDREQYGRQGFRFVPIVLQERMVREVRPALYALLGAVAMLLAIMCANLGVLALVRTARREHELTVRRAIGASQTHVARQVLTETVLLSLGGAAIGALLGVWLLRGLLALAPAGLPRRNEIHIDGMVLAATVVVAVIVGVVIGLAPALRAARADIASVLREKAPSHAGGRMRRTLVLAQLALSVVLLACTGLLLASFLKVQHVDGGFDGEHVLTIQMLVSRGKYRTAPQVLAAFEAQLAGLRAVPGVVAAGASAAPPLSGGADQSSIGFPSSPTNNGQRDHDYVLSEVAPITPGYVNAMGMTLLRGQDIDRSHSDSVSARVALIDDVLAERYFPGADPIGQPITIDNDSLRVIGVVRHVRLYNMEDVGRGQVWVPHALTPYRNLAVAVRAHGDPLALSDAIRASIRRVDRDQAITSMDSMRRQVADSLSIRRLMLALVAAFGAAALLLAALGVYGVTASSVTQRTRELGIRMALGAGRGQVIWSVVNEPTRLIALGLAIGLVATYLLGRVVEKLLYGVSSTDAVTMAAVVVLLLIVGAIASYVPARRATRVDPMVALRAE
jgi:putative ABC transport system permease protein